jgi:hypothetical protein
MKKKNNIVRIEINRGMAELVSKPAGVVVEIADFDIGEDHLETYGVKQVINEKSNKAKRKCDCDFVGCQGC